MVAEFVPGLALIRNLPPNWTQPLHGSFRYLNPTRMNMAAKKIYLRKPFFSPSLDLVNLTSGFESTDTYHGCGAGAVKLLQLRTKL